MKPWAYIVIGILTCALVYFAVNYYNAERQINEQQDKYKENKKQLQQQIDSSQHIIDSITRVDAIRDEYTQRVESLLAIKELNIDSLEKIRSTIRGVVRNYTPTELDSAMSAFHSDSTDYGRRKSVRLSD